MLGENGETSPTAIPKEEYRIPREVTEHQVKHWTVFPFLLSNENSGDGLPLMRTPRGICGF